MVLPTYMSTNNILYQIYKLNSNLCFYSKYGFMYFVLFIFTIFYLPIVNY